MVKLRLEWNEERDEGGEFFRECDGKRAATDERQRNRGALEISVTKRSRGTRKPGSGRGESARVAKHGPRTTPALLHLGDARRCQVCKLFTTDRLSAMKRGGPQLRG